MLSDIAILCFFCIVIHFLLQIIKVGFSPPHSFTAHKRLVHSKLCIPIDLVVVIEEDCFVVVRILYVHAASCHVGRTVLRVCDEHRVTFLRFCYWRLRFAVEIQQKVTLIKFHLCDELQD